MTNTIVLATDNRFWLNRLGSNRRILALVQHLRVQGWQVQVAFMGHSYPIDTAACERLGLSMHHSLPALPMPTEATGPAPAAGPSASQRLRRLQRWLRAASTQFGRPWPASGWWREVSTRSQARTVSDFHDPRHLALLRRLCKIHQPRAVLVEYVHLAWLVPAIPPQVLRLIDTHDVQHERQQRFHAAGEAHGLDITAAEEARLLAAFDVIIAIQNRDARLLAALVPERRVITVMHPQPLRDSPALPDEALDVGFFGSQMAPNVHAARELMERIWPLVDNTLHGRARLLIFGGVCQELAGTPLPPHVELRGFVDDLDNAYDALAVLVNPVRMGGGLKIKNVEALCRGKPLLTTTLGAEGLEDGIDSAFLVEDSGEAFGRRLLDLLQQPARRRALAAGAAAYARTHFVAEQVFAPLDRTLAATSSPAG
jgi:glycosyltransferase involved in cell wall biosynthesis